MLKTTAAPGYKDWRRRVPTVPGRVNLNGPQGSKRNPEVTLLL